MKAVQPYSRKPPSGCRAGKGRHPQNHAYGEEPTRRMKNVVVALPTPLIGAKTRWGNIHGTEERTKAQAAYGTASGPKPVPSFNCRYRAAEGRAYGKTFHAR